MEVSRPVEGWTVQRNHIVLVAACMGNVAGIAAGRVCISGGVS